MQGRRVLSVTRTPGALLITFTWMQSTGTCVYVNKIASTNEYCELNQLKNECHGTFIIVNVHTKRQ